MEPVKAAALRVEIDRTRAEMTRTVTEIEERLSPARVKEQVLEQLKDAKGEVLEQLADAKEQVLEQFHDAKSRVKAEVMTDLDEAKQRVRDGIVEAKTAVREATVGKVETMVNDAKETVSGMGSSIVDTIKANPVPAALIAVGVGWLLVSGGKSTRRSSAENPRIGIRGYEAYEGDVGALSGEAYDDAYGSVETGGPPYLAGGVRRGERGSVGRGIGRAKQAVEGVVEDAGETVSRVAHQASETASHLAHQAGETATRVAHDASLTGRRVARRTGMQVRRAREQAGYQARRAERGVEDAYASSPLAFGAIAVAVGAALGLALPRTQREDQLVGQFRDRLLQSAEEMARGAVQKAERAAGEATEKIAEAAGSIGGGEAQSGPRNGVSQTHRNGASQAV